MSSDPRSTPEVARHRSRKDTRRWCKGKVGVAHQWGWWTVLFPGYWSKLEVRRCSVCRRKQLRSDRG